MTCSVAISTLVIMDANFLVVVSDDGTEYNLTKPPAVESKFVVEAQSRLTETLQISELAADLSNVGKLLLMAYCGVIGQADLEIKIRERFYSITNLCDETVFTLNEFNRASDKAIEIMITAYNYLLEGFEDLAFDMLQDVSQLSKSMVEAASSLRNRFHIEAKKVKGIQKQTMGEKQKVDDALVETQRCINKHTSDYAFKKDEDNKDATEEQQNTGKLNEVTYAQREAAEKKYVLLSNLEDKLKDIQRRLDAANAKLRECSGRGGGFYGAVVHLFGGKTKEDREEEAARISQRNAEFACEMARQQYYSAENAENEKARVLVERREILESNLRLIKQKREKASKDMSEIANKLLQCNLEASAQTDSINCLHHALTALRNLQDIMIIAGNFWRSWISFSEGLSTGNFTKKIEKFMTMEVERRRRIICGSKMFKLEAIKYYSQWVAVQQVCLISRDSITEAQRELHKYIRKNPTKELGKAILEVLAEEFGHGTMPSLPHSS